ncbi:MAG: SGNH/GDSL hydrolase family protein [Microbacteriaceae bacterium]|nr:SGNH/GDSL hydrolase family protein [Microbacteriaceae bacterium]
MSTESTPAATAGYVALGDSFSAGQGSQVSAADLIASSGACERYTTAFPNVWAAQYLRHVSLTSVACSGATVPQVGAVQLPALSATTSLVTITIGGNDAGFVPVVQACVQQTSCQVAIQQSAAFMKDQLPAQLAALYQGIKTYAPHAHVVVLGYPNLFGTGPCTVVGQYLSAPVRQQLDELNAQLSSTIATVAKASQVSYVDARHIFTGHGVCGTEPWINGVGSDPASLLHPNTAGQRAYAKLLTRSVAPGMIGMPPRLSTTNPRSVSTVIDRYVSKRFAAVAGTRPLSYSIVKGSLPQGLKFDAKTGQITGIPRTTGYFTFTWSATNAFGTATAEYTWTITHKNGPYPGTGH